MGRTLFAAALCLVAGAGTAYAEANPDGVAVIIGNKAYKSGVPTVEYAHNDAAAIKRYVVDVLGYREANIIDLRDATKGEIEGALGTREKPQGKLFNWVREGRSDVVVYFSGHGIPGENGTSGFLLGTDADAETANINGYPIDVLMANLEKVPAKSVSVFLDACFSGLSQGGPVSKRASNIGIAAAPVKTAAKNVTVFTAAQGSQLANWDDAAKHGLFTEYLLRGVYGEADKNKDGKVTAAETKAYLDDEMAYQARRQSGRDQKVDLSGSTEVVLASADGGKFPARPKLADIAPAAPAAAPAAAATAAAPSGEAVDQDFVAVREARIRETPDPKAKQVTALKPGAKVLVAEKVTKDSGEWFAVEMGGKRLGYAIASSFEDAVVYQERKQREAEEREAKQQAKAAARQQQALQAQQLQQQHQQQQAMPMSNNMAPNQGGSGNPAEDLAKLQAVGNIFGGLIQGLAAQGGRR